MKKYLSLIAFAMMAVVSFSLNLVLYNSINNLNI